VSTALAVNTKVAAAEEVKRQVKKALIAKAANPNPNPNPNLTLTLTLTLTLSLTLSLTLTHAGVR
jgi:hypothetical protein